MRRFLAISFLVFAAPSWAQNDQLEWQSISYSNSENLAQADLVYGLPETDYIPLWATCPTYADVAYAADEAHGIVRVPLDPTNRTAGESVPTLFTGKDWSYVYSGIFMPAEHSEMLNTAAIHVPFTDPIWEALSAGHKATFDADGTVFEVPLIGSRTAIEAFIGDCEIVQSSPALTSEGLARAKTCEAPSATLDYSLPKTLTISILGNTQALILVDRNNDSIQVNPGQTFEFETYVGETFMAIDGPGNCLEAFSVRAVDTHVTINASGRYFGPE